MEKLIFATNNKHKVAEINDVIGTSFKIITLEEAGIFIDIPEPYNTLEENAIIKAVTIFTLTKTNCFSEDSGLFVDALPGEPGVKSARYKGADESFKDNIDKLLTKLKDTTNRDAAFKTVICLIVQGKQYLFEGSCKGIISKQRMGTGGFGYDPIFIPEGYSNSFAEMSPKEKIKISHRSKAVEKLLAHLSMGGNFGSI